MQAVVEIESLHGAVCSNAWRECDRKATPSLSIFLPRSDLFRLDSSHRKDEGRVQIRPHRVFAEVRELQIVPPCAESVPLKESRGRTRSSATFPTVISMATLWAPPTCASLAWETDGGIPILFAD